MKRETDYAIRTVLCLARREMVAGAAAVSTAELAQEADVPYRFLRKIVLKLATAGILTSRRGKGGGLLLALAPQHITLLQLMQIMEPETLFLNQCLESEHDTCTRKPYCGLHGVLQKTQQDLHAQLADITLLKMVSQEMQMLAQSQ